MGTQKVKKSDLEAIRKIVVLLNVGLLVFTYRQILKTTHECFFLQLSIIYPEHYN